MTETAGNKTKRSYFLPAAVAVISIALLTGYLSSRKAIARANQRVKLQLVQFHVEHSTLPVESAAKTPAAVSKKDSPQEDYRTAIELLRTNYYGKPINRMRVRTLTYNAIRGMLLNLYDPFTSFMTPNEWNQFQDTTTRGDFEGIGAMLLGEPPNTVVEMPIKTGPAEKAGIKAGDIIEAVNGKPCTGKSVDDVVKLIKGPAGTTVHLTILRKKKTLQFHIVRALVKPPIVEYWMEDPKNKIGRVVLDEFNEQTVAQLNHAFAALKKQGMRALIFDLRYNPGGLLTMAVKTASIFVQHNNKLELRDNAVIIHEGSGYEEGRKLEHIPSPYHPMPLVLLVNGSTASASEIVSGCVRDYGVGTLIGERTFGKGCVQTLFPLDDGSCLRLTTALYFTPSHYDLNYKTDEDHQRIPHTGGLLPDIKVKESPKWTPMDFSDKKDDNQLHAAISFLQDRLQGMPLQTALQKVRGQYSPKPQPVRTAMNAVGAPVKR